MEYIVASITEYMESKENFTTARSSRKDTLSFEERKAAIEQIKRESRELWISLIDEAVFLDDEQKEKMRLLADEAVNLLGQPDSSAASDRIIERMTTICTMAEMRDSSLREQSQNLMSKLVGDMAKRDRQIGGMF